MTTEVVAVSMPDALQKLHKWREELETQTKLNSNLRRSTKLIKKYEKTKDPSILEEAIIRLEFEIDWMAQKHDKVLFQEDMKWILVP
jgi:predicted transcriptional regulator